MQMIWIKFVNKSEGGIKISTLFVNLSQASPYLQNINLFPNQLKNKYVSYSSSKTKTNTGHNIYLNEYGLEEVDTVRFLSLNIDSLVI